MTSSGVLVAIALIIIIGYISAAIFRKTRVPELLILMLIGIFLVHILNVVPGNYLQVLRSLAPLFGSLALIVIMFNGSKELKISDPSLRSWRGISLGIIDNLISIAVVSVFMNYVLGWPWIYGIILGTILGETTNIVVIPFIRKVKLSRKMFGAMFTETIINSLVAIAIFSLLLTLINHQSVTPLSFTIYIFDYLSFAAVVGLIASFVWLFASKFLSIAREYVAILAVAILIYGFVDIFNGAAIISVMIFGIVIGNEEIFREIYQKLTARKDEKSESDTRAPQATEKESDQKSVSKVRDDTAGVKEVEKELEFLISTFFFVFMGMITVLSVQFLIYGLAIAALLIIARFIEVRSVLYGYSGNDKNIALALLPRGTTAATLATIVYSLGGIYFMQIFYIVFIVIVVSSIVSSLMLNRVSIEVKQQ